MGTGVKEVSGYRLVGDIKELVLGRIIFVRSVTGRMHEFTIRRRLTKEELNEGIPKKFYMFKDKERWVAQRGESEEEYRGYRSWLKYVFRSGIVYVKD